MEEGTYGHVSRGGFEPLYGEAKGMGVIPK